MIIDQTIYQYSFIENYSTTTSTYSTDYSISWYQF